MSAVKPLSVPARARWRHQLVAASWLVLVWNLLWGDFSWGNVVGGLIVALLVLTFFPLPRVSFAGRVRPVGLVRFVIGFSADLVTASGHLAWFAVRPAAPPRTAIIAVPLRIRTDFHLVLTAEALSLVPGTLIIGVDQRSGTLYVHVFGVRGSSDVARARRDVVRLEARIIAAVGSTEELRKPPSGWDRGAAT